MAKKGTGKPDEASDTPKKRGRPTKYTAELGDEICRRISDGESLRSICRDDHMPDERRVRAWAIDIEHDFSPQYVRAREIAYFRLADELLDLSDDNALDRKKVMRDGEEVEILDHDHIARSRLRVDTRKWLLSKMLPKVFGDKITHQGDAANPIKVEGGIEITIVDPAGEDKG